MQRFHRRRAADRLRNALSVPLVGRWQLSGWGASETAAVRATHVGCGKPCTYYHWISPARSQADSSLGWVSCVPANTARAARTKANGVHTSARVSCNWTETSAWP
jgi:hypothetical protein